MCKNVQELAGIDSATGDDARGMEGEGMARLIDIARTAGVSEATVSRVLNGKAGVNEATRQAVLDVARQLGRDLGPEATGSGPLVGVLVPDLDNQVFAAWAERIEAELFERGATALVAMRARTVEREREFLQRFLHCGVDAIIVVSGHHAQHRGPVDHYREIIAAATPLVLINGVREELDAAFLSSDEEHAVRAVLTHLQELGHQRVGLAVGDEHTWPVREKLRVFEAVTAAWGEQPQPVSFTDFSYAGGYEAARDLVDRGATAILCGSDVMAAGCPRGGALTGAQRPPRRLRGRVRRRLLGVADQSAADHCASGRRLHRTRRRAHRARRRGGLAPTRADRGRGAAPAHRARLDRGGARGGR